MSLIYKKVLLVCVLLMLIGTADNASGTDVVVVAHKGISTTSLTKQQVRNIFLGLQKSLGNDTIKLVTLDGKGTQVHSLFLKTYVGKTPSQYLTHYRKLIFTGKGMAPSTFASESALLHFVARTRGAIGYVSSTAVNDKVVIIRIED